MNIPKAIEILEKEQEDTFMGSEKDWKAAVKLSIEALKFVEDARDITAPYLARLLRGETED